MIIITLDARPAKVRQLARFIRFHRDDPAKVERRWRQECDRRAAFLTVAGTPEAEIAVDLVDLRDLVRAEIEHQDRLDRSWTAPVISIAIARGRRAA